MLERRDHQHPRIGGEDVLGAVAVMDIEIDDGHALDAVSGHRVRGADRDVVEEAEAHRAVALGMMTGRANRAERGAALAGYDEVRREHDGARGMTGRGQRMRVHRRVGIEKMESGRWALGLDRGDVIVTVDPGDGRRRRRRRRIMAQVGCRVPR